MIFGLIFIFILLGIILMLPNGNGDHHLHKITRLPVLENKDQLERLKKARVNPDRLLIEEMQKEDRYISGPFGVASESIDLRTPYHVSSFKQQNEVQAILNKLKNTEDEEEYIQLRNKMEEISRQQRVNVREVMTEFQWQVLQSMAGGQAIPTATAQDAIRDEKLTYKELKKLLPQFQKADKKPVLFNHRTFSIQTRPGSTEKAVESAFEKADENV